MRYLKSTLRATGKLAARVGLSLLLVLLTFALLTSCPEKEKEKKVEKEPDTEMDAAEKMQQHMADIREAAGDKDQEERDTYKLDLLDRLGSSNGTGQGFSTGS